MLIWSLIFEKVATLRELENEWSLDDVMRAHALIEMKQCFEKEQIKAKNVNR